MFDFKDVLTHCIKWLSQLNRASEARKKASKQALIAVVQMARVTQVYLREFEDTDVRNYEKEAEIAKQWTALGYACKDIGLSALAKRCDVTARYWADPEQLPPSYVELADIKLSSIEKRAKQALLTLEED